MLKNLFTSKTRIKLLTLFLLQPEQEYYIRELTRKMDEQINSVRRELTNLKKVGLLRSRVRNRKKYYVVNTNFIIFNELKSIIVKSLNSRDNVIKKIKQIGDIDLLLMAGVFLEKQDQVDLLIVGEIDKTELEKFLNEEVETQQPIRFSILTKDDFLYRLKCSDQFVTQLLKDKRNILGINRLGDEIFRDLR